MARTTAVIKTRAGPIKTHHRAVSLSLLNLAGDPRALRLLLPNMTYIGTAHQAIEKTEIGSVSAKLFSTLANLNDAKEENDHVKEGAIIAGFNMEVQNLLNKIKIADTYPKVQILIVDSWEYKIFTRTEKGGFILDVDKLDIGKLG